MWSGRTRKLREPCLLRVIYTGGDCTVSWTELSPENIMVVTVLVYTELALTVSETNTKIIDLRS